MNKYLKIFVVCAMSLTLCSCQREKNVAVVKGYQGDIKIQVDFEGNTIKSIEILESSETKEVGLQAIQQMIASIIEQQSLDVDIIAGATESCNALLTGMQSILSKSRITLENQKNTPADANETKNQYLYDVVVIGGGGAGLTAAISSAMEVKNVALV